MLRTRTLTFTMSAPDVCRGLPECDCEYYQPDLNPQPGKRATCTECHHGKSKHPSNDHAALPTAGPKTSVLAMFKKINAEGSGKENKYTVSKDEARKEMLSGYRPQLQAVSSGSGSSKPRKVL